MNVGKGDCALNRDAARTPDKRALRSRLRATRDAMAGTPAFAPPPAFLQRLRSCLVATYRPIGGEVDPGLFDMAALAAGSRLALPLVIDRPTPLRFLLVQPGEPLHPGPFGLLNPQAHWPEVQPDLILTPLVGFDRRGNRLGQGAGHYDRAFAAHPAAWRVGLAWSVQEVEALHPDPWDVPLHAIATEREWITP